MSLRRKNQRKNRLQNISADRTLYKSRTGWYNLKYPTYWHAEQEEACLTMYNSVNSVGVLQVSAYHTPSQQDSKDVLLEYLSDNRVSFENEGISVYKSDNKNVATYFYIEDHWYKKVWFISEGLFLFLITYTCKVGQQEKESSEIEDIVSSIEATIAT